MIAIFIWLIGMVIFFFVLFNVIQHALNTSDVAKDLAEIKSLLQERNARDASKQPVKANVDISEAFGHCPACGFVVHSEQTVCPDCGLRLE